MGRLARVHDGIPAVDRYMNKTPLSWISCQWLGGPHGSPRHTRTNWGAADLKTAWRRLMSRLVVWRQGLPCMVRRRRSFVQRPRVGPRAQPVDSVPGASARCASVALFSVFLSPLALDAGRVPVDVATVLFSLEPEARHLKTRSAPRLQLSVVVCRCQWHSGRAKNRKDQTITHSQQIGESTAGRRRTCLDSNGDTWPLLHHLGKAAKSDRTMGRLCSHSFSSRCSVGARADHM